MSVPTNMDIVVCEHTPNHDYVLCGCGCGLLCMCVCVCAACVGVVCVCVWVCVCVGVGVWVAVWMCGCGCGWVCVGWVGARMASYDWSIFFRVPQTFVLKTLTFSWPWERIQRCVITCMSM